MSGTRYEFATELFRWQARSDTWVFARLPQDIADEIEAQPRPAAGFGSVKVEVTLGSSRWRTSIFPSAAEATYVLPVKAAVLRAQGVGAGDLVSLAVETVT